jgi:hypothetical protein
VVTWKITNLTETEDVWEKQSEDCVAFRAVRVVTPHLSLAAGNRRFGISLSNPTESFLRS